MDNKSTKITSVTLILIIISIGLAILVVISLQQINSLQTQVQNLETRIVSLQANNTQLRTQVSSLQNDSTELQSHIDELEAPEHSGCATWRYLSFEEISVDVYLWNYGTKATGSLEVTLEFYDAKGQIIATETKKIGVLQGRSSTSLSFIVQVNPDNITDFKFFIRPEVQEFYEEVPAWNMSDPAVNKLTIDPDRVDPGDQVVFYASVCNMGPTASGSAELVFLVNNTEVGRKTVGPLEPNAEVEVSAPWRAEEHGRYWVSARLEPGENTFDRDSYDNIKTGILRVSGGLPEPELEVDLSGLEPFHPIPGESYNITLNFRNPSFADVRSIPVKFYVDGEMVGSDTIEYLPQGMRQDLHFQWHNVKPGEHMIQVQMDLPEEFPYADLQHVKSWYVTSSDSTTLYSEFQKNKWVSIGPRILTDGVGGLPTGSVGRVNSIAFHPTNKDIMYAGAVRGGVWKTEDGGNSWKPLTDKLLPFFIGRALIVDPNYGDIVYFGTGASNVEIYKSIDGGKNWSPFKNTPSSSGVNKLVLKYEAYASPNFVIYAATKDGLLRYRSTNPWATVSLPNEWTLIKSGDVRDIAVNPVDPNVVYASVKGEGVLFTDRGLTITKDSDWSLCQIGPLIKGLKDKVYTFDVYWDVPGCPATVFAAIADPVDGFNLGIYKSVFPHTSYSLVHLYTKNEIGGLYNPFIRVRPKDPDVIYFGGVGLYKRYISTGKDFEIVGVHADMSDLEWYSESDTYYVCCDGGIWRCTYKPDAADDCIPRNYDLRVTQFYDFDSSQTNPNLMIGGTQDCGTIMYQGVPDWKIINDGDGAYSLIGPGDQVFYSQHQYLFDTWRSEKGKNTWWGDWTSASGTGSRILPEDLKWAGYWWNSYITVSWRDANIVLAQGDQVYFTYDGGKTWDPIGPKGINVKGDVTRIVIQPKTHNWIAGTTTGQIWETSYGGSPWHQIEPETNAIIVSMAFAPTNPHVLYVAYLSGDPYYRVQRFEEIASETWVGSWISGNLPANVHVKAIAGDGYNGSVVYVGTDKGVFRGDVNAPTYDRWHPYNDGLPLIEISDLLVDNTSKQLRAATNGRGAWSAITGP